MGLKNTKSSYGSVTKWLHWLIFFGILGLLIVGFFMDDIADKATKGQVVMLHKSMGLTVLLLGIIRIVWALMNPHPGYSDKVPGWQVFAARSMHFILYALVIAMPLSGWIMSMAAGKTPMYFGLFPVVLPGVPLGRPLAKLANWYHLVLAWTIISFVSLHILAALKHHFINKDNVLKRMLPGGK